MFCQECGQWQSGVGRFCEACGRVISGAAAAPASEAQKKQGASGQSPVVTDEIAMLLSKIPHPRKSCVCGKVQWVVDDVVFHEISNRRRRGCLVALVLSSGLIAMVLVNGVVQHALEQGRINVLYLFMAIALLVGLWVSGRGGWRRVNEPQMTVHFKCAGCGDRHHQVHDIPRDQLLVSDKRQ